MAEPGAFGQPPDEAEVLQRPHNGTPGFRIADIIAPVSDGPGERVRAILVGTRRVIDAAADRVADEISAVDPGHQQRLRRATGDRRLIRTGSAGRDPGVRVEDRIAKRILARYTILVLIVA